MVGFIIRERERERERERSLKHLSVYVPGTCDCDEGYGAKDCSMDLNKPPFVYGVNIDDGGLCDRRHCQRAVVEGFGFLDMETLKCSLSIFQVESHESVCISDDKAETRTIVFKYCTCTCTINSLISIYIHVRFTLKFLRKSFVSTKNINFYVRQY